MTKIRHCLLLLLFLCPAVSLPAIDFGLFGGSMGHPGKLTFGGALRTGMFIPFTRLEFEASRGLEPKRTMMSVALQVTGKFGHLAPYALAGVGTTFDRLNLHFSEYETMTFLGGGIHLYLIEYLSLRGDIRFVRLEGENYTRLSAGIFAHL
ncbi:MAG TPA: hypothetical protein PKK12_03245 [Candidatus Aminicenantes bacterium]|nr:hypothetical protein [Candidatus Aminicenantes bacterium]